MLTLHLERAASSHLARLRTPAERDFKLARRWGLYHRGCAPERRDAARRSPRLGTPVAALVAVALLTTCPTPARAHDPLSERLERADKEVSKHPSDARLVLRRAELYREAGRLGDARADVARATILAPGLPEVALLRGRLRLDGGEPQAARAEMDALLARHPRMAEGRVLRSEALEAEGRIGEAADDLERALDDLVLASPDHYLRLARLLAGTDPPQREREENALRLGIDRLGPTPALVAEAVELELARGNPGAALQWHDRMEPFRKSDPSWIARRGELLEAAGQKLEALAAYSAALDAIEALPKARRMARATRELGAAMRSRLRGATHTRGEAGK